MDPRVVLYPLAGLHASRLRRRGDLEALLRALRRQWLRPEAARALGELGDARAVPSLIALLEDPAARGRPEAAAALGNLKSSAAVKPLINALGRAAPVGAGEWHPDRRVRAEAALALGQIRDRSATEPLAAALDDPDPNLGTAAAAALAELDPDGLDPPLAAHEREVLEVVREVALPLIEAGAASLEIEPTRGPAPASFILRPSSPEACKITIQVDHFQQLSLFMGEPTWCESWHDDRTGYLRWVHDAVEAVVAGRYEEWVHDDGRQAKGVFHLPDGPHPFYDNVLRPGSVGGPGWRHRRYRPYRPGVELEDTGGAR